MGNYCGVRNDNILGSNNFLDDMVELSYAERGTEELIDDEPGVLRLGRGCVVQICTIKHLCEKAQEKALWS